MWCGWIFLAVCTTTAPPELELPIGAWVKLSPLPGAPVSPRLGYEGACAWDSRHRVLIRYGGHNQGGGGEQNSEVWTFDPLTARWALKEPNTSPPGVCCAQQNVFDPAGARYLRFPSFSGNHGWQWRREIDLNDSSVWAYDLSANRWQNRRPLPTPSPKPLRCASWDSHHQVVVLFGGETSQEGTLVYDPYLNTWSDRNPPLEPPFRSGGNMTYDSHRRLHILFGAQFSNDPRTWAYDLEKNRWRDLKPRGMPPSDQNDAVLTYDPFRKVVVAVLKISGGNKESPRHRLETWIFEGAANRWYRLNPPREPDPSGNRARVLSFAPELNAALLENRTHPPHGPPEQQIWALRLADTRSKPPAFPERPRSRPPIVEDAVVSVLSPARVKLTWRASPDPAVKGYLVERAPVEVLSEDQLKQLKSRTPPLPAPSVGTIRQIGQFRRLLAAPLRETSFTDTGLDLNEPAGTQGDPIYTRGFSDERLDRGGKPYRLAVFAYRIYAVNAGGVESGPSPALFTIPSPPQQVFSREEGTSCRLRWRANPEEGLRGYRVYRMDGRWDSDPIQRLTADPISGPHYRDTGAGEKTRRYHVVAVDSLGQEGFPSSPAWFEREWKRYYLPFAGEWHQ